MLQTWRSHWTSSFWGGIFHLLPTKSLQLVMDNINTDYWTASFSLSVFALSRPAGLCAPACSAEPLSVNTQSQAEVNTQANAVFPTSDACLFPFSTCTACVYSEMTVNRWDSGHHLAFLYIFFICQRWRTFLWPHVVSPGLLLATSVCMSDAPFCRWETTMLTNIHSLDWLKIKLKKTPSATFLQTASSQGLKSNVSLTTGTWCVMFCTVWFSLFS